MPDPAQLSSQFIAGPQLTADQIDVDTLLIPIIVPQSDGTYEFCTITAADLYTAMSA